GVLPRSINRVMEPWSARQPLRNQQGPFGSTETLIQLCQIVTRILLPAQHFRSSLLELMGGTSDLCEIRRLAAEACVRLFLCCVTALGVFLSLLLVVVRQNVGIRHANRFDSEDARHL